MTSADANLMRGVLESIDRADPTRSHEAKPSRRLAMSREFRQYRRMLIRSMAIVAALVLAVCLFTH